jgi:membrane protein
MNWQKRIITHFSSTKRFVYFVIEHFFQDDCTYIASALAFTTILAIVPLMSLGLAIFSSFPVFEGLADPLQNFIFDNFVPTTGKVVQGYLQQFTSQVSKLSIFGIIFLTITALLVLVTIERAMNKIWRVSTARHGVPAFLLYWTILSLAPIMLGLSLAGSSYLFSLPLWADNQAPSLIANYTPFILSLIAFTFLYVVVPNAEVKIRHAIWGGLFTAILFEAAKQIFAYYLIRYNTYELLYGAFSAVPVLFIWIYWVWIITLLGAEITYALSVHHQRRIGTSLDGFSHALLWLYQLWLAQQHGKGLNFNELIDTSNQPFLIDAEEMIENLINKELIHATASGEFMLSRDLNQISLYSLTQVLPYHLPTHLELNQPEEFFTQQWEKVFKNIDKVLQKNLDISLEQLFVSNPIAS